MSLIRPGLAALSKMSKQAAEKAATRPFYSAVDKAIAEITVKQPKGTGDQYLAMIMKTKGVKPAEIKDRGIDVALKGKGKTTGEELQRIADENPPPQVSGRVLDDTQMDYNQDGDGYVSNPTHYGEEYADYRTPGGENYREVLFHLPEPKVKQVAPRTLADLQKIGLRVTDFEYNKYTNQASYTIRDAENNFVAKSGGAYGVSTPEQALIKYGLDTAKMDQADLKKASTFNAPHFGGEGKQLLAHARVQDVTGPNGEKIMLIDEIQSDWHQKGRKEGYKLSDAAPLTPDEDKELMALYDLRSDRTPEQTARMHALNNRLNDSLGKGAVPDAPFKKNWHELVMKRLVDDAVKKGYDRVVFTPGAEQAKRYDLSQKVDSIYYVKNDDGTYKLNVVAKGGGSVDLPKESFTAEELPDVLGGEVANKIIAGEGRSDRGKTLRGALSGVDLEIGGEGMKGFYDTILPSYVKKQYGVEVGQHPLKLREFDVVNANGGEGFAVINKGGMNTVAKYPTMEEAQAAAVKMGEVPYHSFDITPEMRESITTQGQPLYQVAPVAGAVGAGMMATSEEPEQYKKGGAVRKPVSMDAMRLATLNKQRK